MNRLEAILHAVALDLAALRLRWAVVGGLAVSARTEPRFTRDVDLVIAVSDDQGAEQAVHSLQRRGYHVHALEERAVREVDDAHHVEDEREARGHEDPG